MPENNSPEELLLTAEDKETMLAVFAHFFFIPFGQHHNPCPICGATYEHHRLVKDDFFIRQCGECGHRRYGRFK